MDHPDEGTRAEARNLFERLEVPDPSVERVIAASLEERPAESSLRARWAVGLLIAIVLLAVPAFFALRPRPQPLAAATTGISNGPDDGFNLSNREGLLVLRSPGGQVLKVTGGRNE